VGATRAEPRSPDALDAAFRTVADAAVWLAERFGSAPQVAVVLGSGLDAVAEALSEAEETNFAEIPGWASGSVAGHSARLTIGRLEGRRVALLRGRVHGYEGFDTEVIQRPLRTLSAWGLREMVITNASGGLGAGLGRGEVAVVETVLDFQAPLADGEPEVLQGSDPSTLVPLTDMLGESGRFVTYAALPGPQYETQAEVAVLKGLGADVVGMSTAQEVRAAREAGAAVTVLTVVTNIAGQSGPDGETVHHEVVEASTAAAGKVLTILSGLLRRLPAEG
jgi:purine-nucleoside phosphorylase